MASAGVVEEVNFVEHDEPDAAGNVVCRKASPRRRHVVPIPPSRHDVPLFRSRLKYNTLFGEGLKILTESRSYVP